MVHRSAAGHTMGGATWVIFALAVVVVIAGLLRPRGWRPILAQMVLPGAALLGLACFFLKMNEITHGFWTPFGHIRPQDVGVKPGLGAYGTAGGFLLAMVGMLLVDPPVVRRARPRDACKPSGAGGAGTV